MDAKTLKTTKLLSKTKLKKTIKNIVCRPDPIFWPKVSEVERDVIVAQLQKYCIKIPEYKKPHWNEIKNIPKDKRPKQDALPKVQGMLFGISECQNAMKSGTCVALIIENDINPKLLAESVIEACNSFLVPHICLKGLREVTKKYFGIATSCLGIEQKNFGELQKLIVEFYELKVPKKSCDESIDIEVKEDVAQPMDIDTNVQLYPYLYRNNNNIRIFIPREGQSGNTTNKFIGQDFIKLPIDERKMNSKIYMNMILKKMQNNPNRNKLKSDKK